ncbi:hypothetical protein [uncultured phage]|nr:hypothetical protein [uncultured phage]CAD8327836.1 hypothetical protein [uncultured phage]
MKNKLKLILGFTLLPFAIALFGIDRIILSFCWWMTCSPIQKWIYDEKKVFNSLVRTVVVFAIYGLIKLIF